MANLDQIPPWLQVTPGLFTSAMEAGARTGLEVAAQSQRAQELVAQRAERESQDQERQAQQAEQQRQFEESHLLNVQKVAQDAQALQQKQAFETAQESRLTNFETGKLALGVQQAQTAADHETARENWADLRDAQATRRSDLLEQHNKDWQEHQANLEDLRQQAIDKERLAPASAYATQAHLLQMELENADYTGLKGDKLDAFKAEKYGQLSVLRDKLNTLPMGPRVSNVPTASTNAPTVLAPTLPASPAATGRIQVRDKTGRRFTVPASQRQQAIAEGYMPIE